jgi:hypothetical protein
MLVIAPQLSLLLHLQQTIPVLSLSLSLSTVLLLHYTTLSRYSYTITNVAFHQRVPLFCPLHLSLLYLSLFSRIEGVSVVQAAA